MGQGFGRSIVPSERRAVIGKAGGEFALLPEGVAPPVFDDRVLDTTRGRYHMRSAAARPVIIGRHGTLHYKRPFTPR